MIIHRKGLGTKNEVQTLIGYPFNATSANASAAIDGKSYSMVTEGSAAWLASTGGRGRLRGRLQRPAAPWWCAGTSQRGTNTTDTYSLSGATAAMNAIDAPANSSVPDAGVPASANLRGRLPSCP